MSIGVSCAVSNCIDNTCFSSLHILYLLICLLKWSVLVVKEVVLFLSGYLVVYYVLAGTFLPSGPAEAKLPPSDAAAASTFPMDTYNQAWSWLFLFQGLKKKDIFGLKVELYPAISIHQRISCGELWLLNQLIKWAFIPLLIKWVLLFQCWLMVDKYF